MMALPGFSDVTPLGSGGLGDVYRVVRVSSWDARGARCETIADGLEPGVLVSAGQNVGEMGSAGRSSGCHLHFGISPPCPGKEWSVRRGVVWRYPYLDAWRIGEPANPAAEVADWLAANPGRCAEAMADPDAGDS